MPGKAKRCEKARQAARKLTVRSSLLCPNYAASALLSLVPIRGDHATHWLGMFLWHQDLHHLRYFWPKVLCLDVCASHPPFILKHFTWTSFTWREPSLEVFSSDELCPELMHGCILSSVRAYVHFIPHGAWAAWIWQQHLDSWSFGHVRGVNLNTREGWMLRSKKSLTY